MALTPRLELRQSQSLVMTPQLQQAIKLLQLSNMELAAYIEEQVAKNPLLEIDDRGAQTNRREERTSDRGDDSATASDNAATDQAISNDHTTAAVESSIDTDYDNLYTDDSRADRQNDQQAAAGPGSTDWSGAKGGSTKFESGDSNIEAYLADELTLREHLEGQLHLTIKDPLERAIGLHLIDTIDDAGYVREDLADIAARLGTEPKAVEATLLKMQSFEPSGVFSRNLGECLALQLKEKDRLDPAMQALIDNLDLLAKHDMPGLLRACNIESDDLADMIKEIRELDPKPGHAFGSEIVQSAIPDVFVRESADGGWRVELNSDTLPRVLIDQHYYAEINNSAKTKEDKSYVSECYANANWLIKSLDQRAKTILKVAIAIVKQQDGFFVHGISHLKPLNLRTIAEDIEMHESTVSRVTANKYMATPRGLFEMKYFFTSAIASSTGGESHSAESVRHRIKTLIDQEAPDEILSDDRIVEILASDGIEIARRTVAKYREAMRIPSSVQRRRTKKLPA